MGPIRRPFGTRPPPDGSGATAGHHELNMPQLSSKQVTLRADTPTAPHTAPPRPIHLTTRPRR